MARRGLEHGRALNSSAWLSPWLSKWTTNCSRESLIAFTNGQTGATNPQRQGLNAALLDGPPPLNILQEIPEQESQFDYSPMWDIHLETWTDSAVTAGLNLRQTDFSAALQQVADGNATGFPARNARCGVRGRRGMTCPSGLAAAANVGAAE